MSETSGNSEGFPFFFGARSELEFAFASRNHICTVQQFLAGDGVSSR